MKDTIFGVTIAIIALILILAVPTGYVLNIMSLMNKEIPPIDMEVALQIIGVIVFPLGVLMGYLV